MKTHISTPIYYVMQAQTIADSAQILNDKQEVIAEVQGKTSEETREIVRMICEAVNEREELRGLLNEYAHHLLNHPLGEGLQKTYNRTLEVLGLNKKEA